MTCFGLLAEMGEEFYAHFGTNPNQANAFGKCVSEQAQAKGEGGEGDAEEPADCEAPAEDEPAATPLDELQEPTEGEEPMDDCAPAEDEPGECDEQADDPPAEDGSAELAASEDPEYRRRVLFGRRGVRRARRERAGGRGRDPVRADLLRSDARTRTRSRSASDPLRERAARRVPRSSHASRAIRKECAGRCKDRPHASRRVSRCAQVQSPVKARRAHREASRRGRLSRGPAKFPSNRYASARRRHPAASSLRGIRWTCYLCGSRRFSAAPVPYLSFPPA